jgi:cytoskeletal protein RodZ
MTPEERKNKTTEHYHIPEEGQTQQKFVDEELAKDPGFTFADWVDTVPVLVESGALSLERIQGWPSSNRISNAVKEYEQETSADAEEPETPDQVTEEETSSQVPTEEEAAEGEAVEMETEQPISAETQERPGEDQISRESQWIKATGLDNHDVFLPAELPLSLVEPYMAAVSRGEPTIGQSFNENMKSPGSSEEPEDAI